MGDIHPTAVIDPASTLADDLTIGPYCVIGGGVSIGKGTVLKSHVVIDGLSSIGEECVLHPFASIGGQTQDLKFKGGHPGVKIGNRVTLREYVTVNVATYDGDVTVIGDDCHIMAYAHVAHDCQIGNKVIMANAATLAGHVIVEDQCIIGGLCGVHQFVRLGSMCITGGCTKIVKDIPPYMMADGNPAVVHTINKIGLERAGVSSEAIKSLREAYKLIFRKNLIVGVAIKEIQSTQPNSDQLDHLLEFIKASDRGITR